MEGRNWLQLVEWQVVDMLRRGQADVAGAPFKGGPGGRVAGRTVEVGDGVRGGRCCCMGMDLRPPGATVELL